MFLLVWTVCCVWVVLMAGSTVWWSVCTYQAGLKWSDDEPFKCWYRLRKQWKNWRLHFPVDVWRKLGSNTVFHHGPRRSRRLKGLCCTMVSVILGGSFFPYVLCFSPSDLNSLYISFPCPPTPPPPLPCRESDPQITHYELLRWNSSLLGCPPNHRSSHPVSFPSRLTLSPSFIDVFVL